MSAEVEADPNVAPRERRVFLRHLHARAQHGASDKQGRLVLRPDAAMPARSSSGCHRAGLPHLLSPALDGTDADAKQAGRLDLWQPSVNGSQQPLAEVGGVLLHPPSFARAQVFRNSL